MSKLNLMTDEDLVVSYAEGNNSAFDVLLNRYKGSVHSYIYFIVRNKELTEDLFQETFVKVITTIKQGRYTDNGKFKAWIMRIAHNLIIDNFRQERNEKIRQLSMQAGKTVKEEGKENNLVDLIAADHAFGLTKADIEKNLKPELYVGRAPRQVEVYLRDVVNPVLEAHKDESGVKAEINV